MTKIYDKYTGELVFKRDGMVIPARFRDFARYDIIQISKSNP